MHALNIRFSFNNTTIVHANSNSGFAFEFAGMMTSRFDLMLTKPLQLTTAQRALIDAIDSEG